MFPVLLPKEVLRGPALAIVPHPDDEVIGCGGMLSWHSSQGHRTVVVHVTDGSAGDPKGKFGDITRKRKEESGRALDVLGIKEVIDLDFPDGRIEDSDVLEREVRKTLEEVNPLTLYLISPLDNHRDHRVVSRVSMKACRNAVPEDADIMVVGINNMGLPNTLVDITELLETKERALRCFETQLAYLDFATKVIYRDKAATVNIEDERVVACEAFMRLKPSRLHEFLERAEGLENVLYGK